MPLQPIPVTDVYQRIGFLQRKRALPLEAFLPPDMEAGTLLLAWPVAWSFFRCGLTTDKDQRQLMSRDVEQAKAALRELGHAELDHDLVAGQKRVQIGRLAKDTALTLHFGIDTDDPTFVAASDATASDEGLPLELVFEVYPAPESARGRPGWKRFVALAIILTPAKEMAPYKGYVALDLGNTNSTLVHIPETGTSVQQVEVLRAEDRETRPVPSAVLLREFKPAPPDAPARYPTAKWDVGRTAINRSESGWLLMGAKRLLADPRAGARHQVWLNQRRVEIDKRLPAELFLCSLFKRFYETIRQRPRRLVVTYPTTFSRREAEALRETVFHAWWRSLGKPEYHQGADSWRKLIPVMLDEATAAALYFLYRDFVEAPGGLSRIRYLYPHRMNLLLYDCGGGTTDIALVQARPGDHRILDIEVLGRTGLRGFGGDNITSATYRVLKAKVAAVIAALHRKPLDPPKAAADWPRWLAAQEDAIDRWVPTAHDPGEIDLPETRARIELTKLLWFWAESFKQAFAGARPDEPRPCKPGQELLARLVAPYPQLQQQLPKVIEAIALKREEIDALIVKDVLQSIENANGLIKSRREKGVLRPDDEVHWVYVVGNASRYPLIKELITRHLKVRFLDGAPAPAGAADAGPTSVLKRGRFRFDEDNLKNAVAKGAVLLMLVREGFLGIRVNFNSDLIDRLPFNITYEDLSGRGEKTRTLFEEHRHLDDIAREVKEIPVPREAAAQAAAEDPYGLPYVADEAAGQHTKFFLSRRWPGNRETEKYLSFFFNGPVEGPTVTVQYNEPKGCFVMEDTGGNREAVDGQEEINTQYCSPMQSGEL